jgi:DNA adenine methylase
MTQDSFVQPFVKWVGGKRQLLPVIKEQVKKAEDFTTYYEPFLGGGAVFLNMQPERAVVNDYNEELINAYKVIASNVDDLIKKLKTYSNSEEEFYRVRALDRSEEYKSISNVDKAARLIFLNRTCYNGLYRVNQQGFFNTPYGHYKKPNIVNEIGLRHLSDYFNSNKIKFCSGDFEDALKGIRKGALVYLDPPYAPLTSTSNFTGYTSGGFGENEQIRLANLCKKLDIKGVKFILSNSNVPLIQELYKGFNINIVLAKRNINSIGNKRGDVEEVLITNF